MLRKSIVISLVILFLSANTELIQVLKLPNLLHHFIEHEKEHGKQHVASLLEFIKMHYAGAEHHHKKDGKEHENLPFKTLNHSTNSILAFQKMEIFTFSRNIVLPKDSTIAFSPQLYNSGVFASIWLPPKLS